MMNSLYFQLLGTRGSRPILDQEFIRFGGNTTSYKIWAKGLFPIYVDGGTGLFREGHRVFEQTNHFTFLLTHAHWDHILSFPFFKPFYHPDTYARFWGSASFKETFEELFQHQFQTDAFPVNYSELPAKIEFTSITTKQTFIITPPIQSVQDVTSPRISREYIVHTYQLNHPGYDLGYRIEYASKSIVILTDTAPIENNHLGYGMQNYTKEDEKRYYQGLIEFSRDADLVLYDTHFNEETIKGKESWGHSTEVMAVNVALECGAQKLILGHHAPEDNDHAILKKLENARRLSKSHSLEVFILEENEIIDV
jgi:ribonuclease BN (tRNA processing enzyme)